MSRIGTIGGGPAAPRRAARSASGFALQEASVRSRQVNASPASNIAALLGVQEDGPSVTPPTERARRRADAGLDELRGLQLDMLRGEADPARLARLAALAETAHTDEAGLREALADIALRLRIEHARQRMALAGRFGSSPA